METHAHLSYKSGGERAKRERLREPSCPQIEERVFVKLTLRKAANLEQAGGLNLTDRPLNRALRHFFSYYHAFER